MRVCVRYAIFNQRDCELGGLRTAIRHSWLSVKAWVFCHCGHLSCLYELSAKTCTNWVRTAYSPGLGVGVGVGDRSRFTFLAKAVLTLQV